MIKTIFTVLSIGLFCFATEAQNSSTSTVPPSGAASLESTGTITEYTPESSLVLDTGSGEPVHFVFGKTVNYVGADGQSVQASGLRKNLRVRVHYIKNRGDNVIDKVILTE